MNFLSENLEEARKGGKVEGVVVLSHFLPSSPFFPSSILEEWGGGKRGKRGLNFRGGKGRREIEVGRRGGGKGEKEKEKGEEEEEKRGGGGGRVGPPVIFWGFGEGEGEGGGDWLVRSENPDDPDHVFRLVSQPFF